MNDAPLPPSNAERPDLDWSQVRETVLMLNAAVAQISRTMQDGDDSVGTLTDSFTSMAGNAGIIAEAGAQLADGPAKAAIVDNCRSISAQMQGAIVAFQFYDKLTQRLGHVSHSLAALADLVSDPGRLYSPYEWHGLQQKIRAKYTSEGDKAMFDAIVRGASTEEALDLAEAREKAAGDDVELF